MKYKNRFLRQTTFLIFFFSFFLNAGFAQNFSIDVKHGDEKEPKKIQRPYGIEPVGADNEFVYYLFLPFTHYSTMMYIGKAEYILVKYNRETQKFVSSAALEINQGKRNSEFHSVILINNEMFLFTSYQNKKKEKHFLFVQNIDKTTLKSKGELRLIGELDYSDIKKYKRTALQVESSPDSTKILVYYNALNKSEFSLKQGICVFSDNMDMLWKNENIEPTMSGEIFEYQKFRIDNEGNVYLKGISYETEDEYRKEA